MSTARNVTYKHLRDPTRIFGFTLGQWAFVGTCLVLAIAFGVYLSPFPAGPTFMLVMMFGVAPAAATYGLGGVDMPIAATYKALKGWLRAPRRFLPGSGEIVAGYVVQATANGSRTSRPVGEVEAAREQIKGMWD